MKRKWIIECKQSICEGMAVIGRSAFIRDIQYSQSLQQNSANQPAGGVVVDCVDSGVAVAGCGGRGVGGCLFFIEIYQQMGLRLGLAGILLLLGLVSSTTITFYVDHEVEQPLDYVEISAIVKTSGDSLEETIDAAAAIIASVDAAVKEYCRSYAKDKAECEGIVETDPYSIKPQYELLKKKPLFAGFVVAHEMLIRVKQAPLFGKLVDDILKRGVNRINSLEWKPLVEVDGEEIAVAEGIEQANAICKKIGMQLDRIVSVQEVTDYGEDQEEEEEGEEGQLSEEEEEQEEQEEEEPLDIKDGIVYYKFVVECHPKKK